jgi:hypothetical protein
LGGIFEIKFETWLTGGPEHGGGDSTASKTVSNRLEYCKAVALSA